MVFRKIFRGKRSRSKKENCSHVNSFGRSPSSGLGRKSPGRYEPAVVETVSTADDQDDDNHASDARHETLHAIYMFPTVWKERTGSRCYGAYDTINTERNQNSGELGSHDDDSMTGMMMRHDDDDDDDDAWDYDVVVNEERYRTDPAFSSWMATSLSCLTCKKKKKKKKKKAGRLHQTPSGTLV
eukprot:jgi/Psemu1/26906/gm1.26906_g